MSDNDRLALIEADLKNVVDLTYDDKYKTLDITGTNKSVANLNMPNMTSGQADFYGNFFMNAASDIKFLLEQLKGKQNGVG